MNTLQGQKKGIQSLLNFFYQEEEEILKFENTQKK